jgi:hypothetical protein
MYTVYCAPTMLHNMYVTSSYGICPVLELDNMYVTSSYGICPVLELDGWSAHPKLEIPGWDGVLIHQEAKCIPIGNVFLKIHRIVMHNSSLGHPNLELLSNCITMT